MNNIARLFLDKTNSDREISEIDTYKYGDIFIETNINSFDLKLMEIISEKLYKSIVLKNRYNNINFTILKRHDAFNVTCTADTRSERSIFLAGSSGSSLEAAITETLTELSEDLKDKLALQFQEPNHDRTYPGTRHEQKVEIHAKKLVNDLAVRLKDIYGSAPAYKDERSMPNTIRDQLKQIDIVNTPVWPKLNTEHAGLEFVGLEVGNEPVQVDSSGNFESRGRILGRAPYRGFSSRVRMGSIAIPVVFFGKTNGLDSNINEIHIELS